MKRRCTDSSWFMSVTATGYYTGLQYSTIGRTYVVKALHKILAFVPGWPNIAGDVSPASPVALTPTRGRLGGERCRRRWPVVADDVASTATCCCGCCCCCDDAWWPPPRHTPTHLQLCRQRASTTHTEAIVHSRLRRGSVLPTGGSVQVPCSLICI